MMLLICMDGLLGVIIRSVNSRQYAGGQTKHRGDGVFFHCMKYYTSAAMVHISPVGPSFRFQWLQAPIIPVNFHFRKTAETGLPLGIGEAYFLGNRRRVFK